MADDPLGPAVDPTVATGAGIPSGDEVPGATAGMADAGAGPGSGDGSTEGNDAALLAAAGAALVVGGAGGLVWFLTWRRRSTAWRG